MRRTAKALVPAGVYDIIVNDMPFTVLFFRKGNVMSGSKIKSEILPSVDRMFRNIETWSVTE